MEQFPSETDLGDVLSLGVNIEPEQRGLLEAPHRRPIVAVWGLPDPVMESGNPFYVNGVPAVVPIIMDKCVPSEKAPLWHGGPSRTLGELLVGPQAQDPFPRPTIVGEIEDDGMFPYRMGDFELMDDHFGRDLWDLWPIEDARVYQVALEAALDKSGYLALIDWFQWEMGHCDPCDDQHFKMVEDLVTDGIGNLKDPDEFEVKIHLPKEQQYIWERLIDISQQGATSYGMSLPLKERAAFFRLNGATPWF